MRLLPALVLAFLLPLGARAQNAIAPEDDAAIAAPLSEAEALHLRDGAIHWGAVRAHDPDGIEFQRLDTGGLVRVPWELLDPRQSEEWKRRYGYVQLATEELLIDGDRIELDTGEEVIGKIISREGDDYVVKTGGNLQIIPKSRVAPGGVQSGLSIPALDVYTREEIYLQHLTQASPQSATDQWTLAETCERILDYTHALEHYETAKRLDPELHADEIDAVIERTRAAAGQQEQLDYLREIDVLRKRGEFDAALERAAAFPTTWPQSPLLARAHAIHQQVEAARWSAIVEFVRRRWNARLLQLTRTAALQQTYAQALAYAEEQLGLELRARVLEDARKTFSEKLELADVERAWAARRKVRYTSASYGFGTWLLGEDAARKGLDEEEKEDTPVSEKDAERVKLEEKMKRFLANIEAAAKQKSRAEQEEDYEAFWAAFPTGGRSQWIRAYHAEFGGDFELRAKPRFELCRGCGGTGAREVTFVGGGGISGVGGSDTVVQRCQTCMGIGVVRKIYYR